MPQFEVRWTMDVEADGSIQAAEAAWKALRGAGSIANHFTVQDQAGNIDKIDLMEHYGDAGRPEDLADLAPELVQALDRMLDVTTGDIAAALGIYSILARAERATKGGHIET